MEVAATAKDHPETTVGSKCLLDMTNNNNNNNSPRTTWPGWGVYQRVRSLLVQHAIRHRVLVLILSQPLSTVDTKSRRLVSRVEWTHCRYAYMSCCDLGRWDNLGSSLAQCSVHPLPSSISKCICAECKKLKCVMISMIDHRPHISNEEFRYNERLCKLLRKPNDEFANWTRLCKKLALCLLTLCMDFL